MAYELPPLPYAYDALEPHIDARTMEIHHTKHHQAYINNANKALEGHANWAAKAVDQLLREINDVPDAIRQTLTNNAGGHWNHTRFWQIMGPKKGGEPRGDVAKAISEVFGNFAAFKEKFSQAALGRFGSGWAWLAFDEHGKLLIESTPNQDCPLMVAHVPILGLDVWEHAYYLKYQNRRADYVAAWWNVVNWDQVAEYYDAAKRRR